MSKKSLVLSRASVSFLVLLVLVFTFVGTVSANNGCFEWDVECGTSPTDNCGVIQDIIFNSGNYDFPDDIDICSDNIVLDYNGDVLSGDHSPSGYSNYGTYLKNTQDTTVKDYNMGIAQAGELNFEAVSTWGGVVNDVEVVGDLAYVAAGRELLILNIADAANPVKVGSIDLTSVRSVAVRDNYAFVAAYRPYRFSVVDVSDPTNPTLVWNAPVFANIEPEQVELYGDFAYVRNRDGDFSNPIGRYIDIFYIADPENVFYLEPLLIAGEVDAMAIVGDFLYIAPFDVGVGGYQAFFKIYDLSVNPLNPALLGTVGDDYTPYPPGLDTLSFGIEIEGNYAYWDVFRIDFGENPYQINIRSILHVVDISNPQQPVIVGGTGDPGELVAQSYGLAVSGGFAYVADAASPPWNTWADAKGLAIFDVATDPTNPTLVGTFKTHGFVRGVKIVGTRAYLYDDGEGLIILDISDPINPVRLGNYYSPGRLGEMVKVDDLLYVSDMFNGFTILDVSNPADPIVVGKYLAEHVDDLDIDVSGITVRDNRVYLGVGQIGFEVVDVSNPTNPTLLGAFRILPPNNLLFSKITGVGLSDNIAHVGFDECIVDECYIGSPYDCIFCEGNFLNLDVSNPKNIVEVGRIDFGPGSTQSSPKGHIVLNSEGTAFIGRGAYFYPDTVIDASDPKDPFVIHVGDIPHAAVVALEDTLLSIASPLGDPAAGGLYLQDVSDPANPETLVHLGGEDALSRAFTVGIQNQRVYVVGSEYPTGENEAELTVWDVSDPTAPVLLDVAPWVGGPKSSVFIEEPYVYVTSKSQVAFDGFSIHKLNGLMLCPADFDNSGDVGVKDLLILLGAWGQNPGHPADLDNDGSVGVKDLLILLGSWGPCSEGIAAGETPTTEAGDILRDFFGDEEIPDGIKDYLGISEEYREPIEIDEEDQEVLMDSEGELSETIKRGRIK